MKHEIHTAEFTTTDIEQIVARAFESGRKAGIIEGKLIKLEEASAANTAAIRETAKHIEKINREEREWSERRDEEMNAPYLKPTIDRPVERVGGIRIN